MLQRPKSSISWPASRKPCSAATSVAQLIALLLVARFLYDVQLPTDAGRLRARLHALEAVRGESHDDSGWRLRVDLALADAARLAAQADGAPLRVLLPELLPE